MSPLDLHVLGTPPAFVLSQDQTLPFNPFIAFLGSLPFRFLPLGPRFSLFGIFAVYLVRGARGTCPRGARAIPFLNDFAFDFSVSFSRFAPALSCVLPVRLSAFSSGRSSELGYNTKPKACCQPFF